MTNLVVGEEKVLNVYNWSDYIAEDTIAKFEKETGIKVNYDVFDGNEILEAKLLAGSSGYDVVVPSASFIDRQIKAGIFQKLNKSALPNKKNLDKAIAKRVSVYDPGNKYSVVYMWGTVGFGYNEEAIKKRMPNAPVGSWAMLFDPKVVSKFKDCGVSFLDSPTDVIPAALAYLGLNPDSKKTKDLKKAEQVIAKVRPYIRSFNSSQYINDLANGDSCVSMGWSGDVLIAIDRAAEAEQKFSVSYVIPKEGTVIWFDVLAIPKDAPHPKNAHKFLNFLMKPKIIADITNYVFYPNGNSASTPYIEKEILEDPSIYPPASVKKNLFATSTNSKKYDRLLTRAWTRLKSGKYFYIV